MQSDEEGAGEPQQPSEADQELAFACKTIFKRVTDEKILRDVVPRRAFSIFQHAYDWACGKANLCKPFSHPTVDMRLADRVLGRGVGGDA